MAGKGELPVWIDCRSTPRHGMTNRLVPCGVCQWTECVLAWYAMQDLEFLFGLVELYFPQEYAPY